MMERSSLGRSLKRKCFEVSGQKRKEEEEREERGINRLLMSQTLGV